MSIESYALANSRPPAFAAVRAEPNLLQRLHPLSATQHSEAYFGRVPPVVQYRADMPRSIRRATPLWNISGSTLEATSNQLDFALALQHTWPRVSSDAYYIEPLGGTTILVPHHVPHHAPTELHFVANRTAVSAPPDRLSPIHTSTRQSLNPGAQPFMLIERAKQFLSQQRIRDARRTLELGAIRYPGDGQIASLLRAISPGRVSATDRDATNRERETAWIRQHGHKYRGQWIALNGDRLIAFAGTLKDLLADIDAIDERDQPPLIQQLLPE